MENIIRNLTILPKSPPHSFPPQVLSSILYIMPPRFPHGLKKNPIHMNWAEKTVFALLGLSMGAGLFNLATSPLYAKDSDKNEKKETEDGKKKNYSFSV